jgi:hypothetical protein
MTYLTTEKFQDIYTDEKFRNQVAYANPSHDAHGQFKYWETATYPIRYIVSEEQITEALWEIERVKTILRKQHTNSLLLIGMGTTYPERFADDVCNDRVRAYFKNPSGNLYFIEFMSAIQGTTFIITHANDETKAAALNQDHYRQSEYFNFKNLEHLGSSFGIFSKRNLLKVVNKYFKCHFTRVVIDSYNFRPDEITSISPTLPTTGRRSNKSAR